MLDDQIGGFLDADGSFTDGQDEEDDDVGEWFEFDDDGDTFLASCQSLPGSSKPKRKRLKRQDYIPRVVKHDIRRFYSRMLANVANQHDLSFYKSFMETFANRPTLSFVFEDLAPPSLLHDETQLPPSCPIARFALRGIEELLCFESVNHQLSPDTVTHIVHSTIHTRSDSHGSEVRSIFRIELSMLHPVNSRELVHDMMVAMGFRDCFKPYSQGTGTSWPVASIPASASASLWPSSSSFSTPPTWETSNDVMRVYREHQPLSPLNFPNIFDLYRVKHGQVMPQYPTPRQITVEIALTMKLNERRQIETIVFQKPHFFRSQR